MRTTAIAILLLVYGLAGAATMSGPIAGYVAESSGTVLRPILGVPGSYRFGDPMALPEEVRRVRVAPGQDYALAEFADAGVGILRLSGVKVDGVTPIPGTIPRADWVVFSPGAASAVLVSVTDSRLQVISGLPGAPRIAREMDIATLPEVARTAAVSDDGRLLLVASRQRLYMVTQGGAAQLLTSVREIASLALFRNGVDAAVWDSAGSIHLWHALTSAPADQTLASGMKGVGKLYPSWDGRTLFALLPGTRAILSIEVASGEVTYIDTDEAPLVLDPLRNYDTFLISAKPRQPGRIFYRDGNDGRVVFVVPPPEKLP